MMTLSYETVVLLWSEALCTVSFNNFIFIDNSLVEFSVPVFCSNIFLGLLRWFCRLTISFEVLPDKSDYYLSYLRARLGKALSFEGVISTII